MKKLTCLLSLCMAMHAHAATVITASSVSGHWTLAGAPYDVYNDIQVLGGQSLAIDPGVSVVFHGSYKLMVNGILYAVGTSSAPINFQVADTTGFYTDNTTTAGGWHGIQFFSYSGAGMDSSALQYCNITYTKFDAADYFASPEVHTLHVGRKLTLNNCNIHENKSNPGSAVDLIKMYPATGVVVEYASCSIYNNNCDHLLMYSYNDSTYMHECKIYQNTSQINTVNQESGGFCFINNDVYNNTQLTVTGGEGILTVNSNATIKGNKIHDNLCQQDAAIFSGGGFVNIISNLICNNQHVSGLCGLVDGGGALNLSCNYSGTTHATTFFTVRNNILANNFSSFEGGAIKIYNSGAIITNNQIINNSSPTAGAIFISDGDSSSYIIKNNIFLGNTTGSFASVSSPVVVAYINYGNLEYDHNWQEAPTAFELSVSGTAFTISGDTTKNITGTDPGMISPTTNSLVSTSALTANFDLKPTSVCIDKGDTTGIVTEPFDYAGRVRIFNEKIDIGAYEYIPAALSLPSMPVADAMNVYPNPARDIVNIYLPGAKGTIRLMDLSGKQLMQQDVTNTVTVLDVHTVSPGIYFVIWNDGNNMKTVQKILVQ